MLVGRGLRPGSVCQLRKRDALFSDVGCIIRVCACVCLLDSDSGSHSALQAVDDAGGSEESGGDDSDEMGSVILVVFFFLSLFSSGSFNKY